LQAALIWQPLKRNIMTVLFGCTFLVVNNTKHSFNAHICFFNHLVRYGYMSKFYETLVTLKEISPLSRMNLTGVSVKFFLRRLV